MASSPPLAAEKKHWWMSNRKLVGKYLREARALVATREQANVPAAMGLLDAALALSPRHEAALELKARSLLFLRRFREVADMLQDCIPSYKNGAGDDVSSTSLGSAASAPLDRNRAELLSPGRSFRCFSVSDLKRKVMACLSESSGEGHWRYLVLGHACCRLGLMEDAMVLLQAGRRLAAAASRRRSICCPDDSFISYSSAAAGGNVAAPTPTESESASQLLSHIKLLLRRSVAAMAALDAGVPVEATRHFSKVLDSRRGIPIPAGFAAGCFVGRASAHRAAGRLVEAIADCNRALAVEPSCVLALRARADLFEAVGALPDCLHDLDHLKLLYDSILRDGKLPGPRWRPHHGVRYRDIPAEHRALAARMQQLRCQVAAVGGCSGDVDYYALMGVHRGCTRSELERAQLLLSLRHKPEKAATFVDRLEFADDHRDPDSVRDQAKMSATILYRMLQKGYSRIMGTVMDEEAAAARQRAAAAVVAAARAAAAAGSETAAFQGMYCRDMAAVGSMLSHSAIPVK